MGARMASVHPEGFCVIKFGGSLVSDRGQVMVLAPARIRACVAALVRYREGAARLPIVLLGGGGFAHPIAHRIAQDPDPSHHSAYAEQMAEAMDILREAFAAQGRAAGLKVRTWSVEALFAADSTGFYLRRPVPADLFQRGTLQIMTGGCGADSTGRISVLSSDDIALILSSGLPIRSAAFITDVEGLFDFGDRLGPPQLVRDVAAHAAQDARRLCGENKLNDMTGGMGRKVRNCASLIARGIPCYIGDGMHLEDHSIISIEQGERLGTYFHAQLPCA